MSSVMLPFETGQRDVPDYNLLLTRLEQQIVLGENPEKTRQTLQDERVWNSLEVKNRLRWASLAQMAGDTETACRVFTHIHQTSPAEIEAWQNHLELLFILNKADKIAQVLALARKAVGESQYQEWVKVYTSPAGSGPETDIDAASKPFEIMRYRQDAVMRYMNLFSGREDCFARQWVERSENKQGYVPVRRPLQSHDLEEHFKGLKTYGMYLLQSDGLVRTAVMDVDLSKKFRSAKLTPDEKNQVKREIAYCMDRINELSQKAGLWPLIEFSGGKGYHFWYFFDEPVPPEKVRSALEKIRLGIAGDLGAFSIEVFPKQDSLKGKGLGNLVKLPLGVHRLTGKRSCFIKCNSRTLEAQLDYLSTVRTTGIDSLDTMDQADKDKTVFIHPRWEAYARSYPELVALETKCPPLGQIMASARNGRNSSIREEKILFQTIGFLPRAGTLIHHLLSSLPDYNPHLVDFKLSRVRGTPLGCRRIHSLINYTGNLCFFREVPDYPHPLLHLEEGKTCTAKISEKVGNLNAALENLKTAIIQAQSFLKS